MLRELNEIEMESIGGGYVCSPEGCEPLPRQREPFQWPYYPPQPVPSSPYYGGYQPSYGGGSTPPASTPAPQPTPVAPPPSILPAPPPFNPFLQPYM